MQHENNSQQETADGKTAPQNVSANSEQAAKQKTAPLEPSGDQREDQREGKMNNGELGANLQDTEK